MPDATVFTLVQEYCKLSKVMNPSEAVADKMIGILELAQHDPELACLLNEADHLMAFELGLKDAPDDQP